MIALRNRLRAVCATVDKLTARMLAYVPEPPECTGIHPGDTARFGVLLNGNREHG